MKVGILVPVWKDYHAIAPLTQRFIDRYWDQHPEIWFCGLEKSDFPELNVVGMSPDTDRSNWTQVLLDGVKGMIARGYDLIYLIAEEHVPLKTCHAVHLNETLPGLMKLLDASYISLMGWDNRRFVSKSPVLHREHFELKHLVGDRDPRFHLHPALWDAEVLGTCCKAALANGRSHGSAWNFEKSLDRKDSPLPENWKRTCYQIRASAMSAHAPKFIASLQQWSDRAFYHKLMAVVPLLPRQWVTPYVRTVPFDDVYCEGPYPLFFSGIMAKGAVNLYFKKFLIRSNPSLWEEISGVLSSL